MEYGEWGHEGRVVEFGGMGGGSRRINNEKTRYFPRISVGDFNKSKIRTIRRKERTIHANFGQSVSQSIS